MKEIRQAIGLGVVLMTLGAGTFAVWRFEGTGFVILVPALFGLVFLVLGVLGWWKVRWRSVALQLALALAFIIFVGTLPGLWRLIEMIGGATVPGPAWALEQGVTALLCAGFMAFALKPVLRIRRQGGVASR